MHCHVCHCEILIPKSRGGYGPSDFEDAGAPEMKQPLIGYEKLATGSLSAKDSVPFEPWKTVGALVFMLLGIVTTMTSLAMTHDRYRL